jgi:hypothetical protein
LKRTCALVEASFDPSGEFCVGDLPDTPSAPTFINHPPDVADYDLSNLSGYVESVKGFAADVERFEREVEAYEAEVDGYASEVDEAYENAELPSLLRSFRNGDMHQEMEQSGVLPSDEIVVLLRGDYDRLIHAADEECACVFDSARKCIHRGCWLTAADWEVTEVAHG